MAVKPLTYLNWDTTNANLLTPPAGFLQVGYTPGQAPPAEYDNYAIQLLDLWIQWLDFITTGIGNGFQNQTSNFTASQTYASYFCNPNTIASFTATLPSSATVAGQIWRIKNTAFTGARTVTVALANAGDALEGTVAGTVVLNPGEILVVQSDGAGNYFQITP